MTLAADKILVTVGRKPVTEGWGLEAIDLDMDGPFIRIDDQCRTSMRGVYAIGDVTGEPMLAHRAIGAGRDGGRDRRRQEALLGQGLHSRRSASPIPEIVTAGLSPEEAKAAGIEIEDRRLPVPGQRPRHDARDEAGFIRVVARADNHLVLGIQAVGDGISELSAAFSLAIEMGARLEDVAGTIHAHPTRRRSLPRGRASRPRPSHPYLTRRCGAFSGQAPAHSSASLRSVAARPAPRILDEDQGESREENGSLPG